VQGNYQELEPQVEGRGRSGLAGVTASLSKEPKRTRNTKGLTKRRGSRLNVIRGGLEGGR